MKLLALLQQKIAMEIPVMEKIIQLLDEGNTIPFIARYRKELTHGATDEDLRLFHETYLYVKHLEERKQDVIRLIKERGLLTDELEQEILSAETLAKVEDLYRPFKEKKNTKATLAKAKGLEPLSLILQEAKLSKEEFEEEAKSFINDTWDSKTSVMSIEEAIQWAKDILAELVSDHAGLREVIRVAEQNSSLLVTKASKTFDDKGVYKIYKEYSKPLSHMPSYAYLAITRAEKEKQLSVKLQFSKEKNLTTAQELFIPNDANSSSCYIEEAVQDGLDRLLLPSLERELRSEKKKWADESAIKVFWDNLKNLLLTPPIKKLRVLWFDPAFRTWCKLAVVDETGKFLAKTVIYPTAPQNKTKEAEAVLLDLIKKYQIEVIAIGNGTASRESEKFVAEVIKRNKLSAQYIIVSEAGASVYSASQLAQEEYPDLDVTIRGAISIAHRVQDPLAELTKIDPKAIGVGQYQHDVDQKYLKEKLDEKVEDIVNAVGVDINTASYTLLQYVAGLSLALAKNVVLYREEAGEFSNRKQVKKVKGLGPKSYAQAIGFLRIKEGKEALDMTGIHPESYDQAYLFIEKELGIKKKDIQLPLLDMPSFSEQQLSLLAEQYELGRETLEDILEELKRPGLDPREDIEAPCFKSDIVDIADISIGSELEGVVRNVTDFGAFVDIGLHNDGLVHKSQMADYFVTNPIEVVKVGQQVKVRVIDIDVEREKISLSMKGQGSTAPAPRKKVEAPRERETPSTLSGNISFS